MQKILQLVAMVLNFIVKFFLVCLVSIMMESCSWGKNTVFFSSIQRLKNEAKKVLSYPTLLNGNATDCSTLSVSFLFQSMLQLDQSVKYSKFEIVWNQFFNRRNSQLGYHLFMRNQGFKLKYWPSWVGGPFCKMFFILHFLKESYKKFWNKISEL